MYSRGPRSPHDSLPAFYGLYCSFLCSSAFQYLTFSCFLFYLTLHGSQSLYKVWCDAMDPSVGNIKREGSDVPLCLVTRESSVPRPSPAVSVVRLHLSVCSDSQRPVQGEQQDRRRLEPVTATVNPQRLHFGHQDGNPGQPKEENNEKTIEGDNHNLSQATDVKENPLSDSALCLCDTCGCQHVASGKCEACGAICHFKERRNRKNRRLLKMQRDHE